VVLQVGVTNGTLGDISSLTKLNSLHIADAYRVTNIGLQFIFTLTGALSLAECLSTTSKECASLQRSSLSSWCFAPNVSLLLYKPAHQDWLAQY
jgi:hypothetical protein